MATKKRMDSKMGVVLSDVHVPFQDKSVCRMALSFIKEQKPAKVHLLGDISDCYSISRFVKDPRRKEDLQEDLDLTMDFLDKVRDAAGDAQIIYSEGNHEFRLRRYLASEARALSGLRSLNLPSLLQFDRLKILWRPHDRPYRIGALLYTHGQLIRKWSGATARAHFEKYGCCVIHGHSHRLGAFYRRDISDTYIASESGCLCGLNPDYCTAPDWQQGWSVVWTQYKYFHIEQVAVVQGRYNYHGKAYGRKQERVGTGKRIDDLS